MATGVSEYEWTVAVVIAAFGSCQGSTVTGESVKAVQNCFVPVSTRGGVFLVEDKMASNIRPAKTSLARLVILDNYCSRRLQQIPRIT